MSRITNLTRFYQEKRSLKGDVLSQVTYSSLKNGDDVVLLRSFDRANQVTLSWHNINVFVRPEKKKIWKFKNKYDTKEQKQILQNVSGQVKPGQLLAIMGASGAGKTTLLNVLNNRNLRSLVVDGEVLVNGENVGDSMARVSSFIQQDDLFIGTLTVKEHLVFQALLRMDKHISTKDRMTRVDKVIHELGLKKCADTVIGIPGRVKGISGGESKRLAFASEILTNPALLFCDEPTSGLDSFMAENIITVLRNMAAGGRTIVCTIHQPSSEVFEMFDQLLLMAEGRVAYLGDASKATSFFERAGLRCPMNYNPADFFIHNLAVVPGKEAECKQKIMNIRNQFAKEFQTIERTVSAAPSIMQYHLKDKSKYKASWLTQFGVLMRRSWLSLVRQPMFTKVRFFQSFFVAVLLGLIYLNQRLDQKGIMNIDGALFLMLTNLTFQTFFPVVNVFCLEKPIFIREHWNGMYRTDVYFLTKTLAEAPVLIMVTLVFTTIMYWMVGMNSDWRAFMICLAITNLVANAAASFGYMVSCFSSSLTVALGVATPLLMPLLLFGGFYLNNASVPVYFVWVKYISWFYYANEALSINQWSTITNITCSEMSCLENGKDVLKRLSFNESHLALDIGMMAVLIVCFRLMAFLGLHIRASQKT